MREAEASIKPLAPGAGLRVTPLFALHRELGAKLVPFAGYEMPLQYANGIVKEHHHVRSAAGSVSLAREARGKLVAVCQRERLARGERFMGVDVPALLQDIDAAFAPVFQAERHGVVPPLAAPVVLELSGG